MGTRASILYADKSLTLHHDGDPRCVLESINSAFIEADGVPSVHLHRVVMSLLADDLGAMLHDGVFATSADEWYYFLHDVNGVMNIHICNYGKLKYDGPLQCAPKTFESDEEE